MRALRCRSLTTPEAGEAKFNAAWGKKQAREASGFACSQSGAPSPAYFSDLPLSREFPLLPASNSMAIEPTRTRDARDLSAGRRCHWPHGESPVRMHAKAGSAASVELETWLVNVAGPATHARRSEK